MPDTVLGLMQSQAAKLGAVEVTVNTLQTENQTLREQIADLRRLVSDTQAALLQVQARIG